MREKLGNTNSVVIRDNIKLLTGGEKYQYKAFSFIVMNTQEKSTLTLILELKEERENRLKQQKKNHQKRRA